MKEVYQSSSTLCPSWLVPTSVSRCSCCQVKAWHLEKAVILNQNLHSPLLASWILYEVFVLLPYKTQLPKGNRSKVCKATSRASQTWKEISLLSRTKLPSLPALGTA